MRMLLLAGAAAMFAVAAPATAQPGKGHGNHGDHAAKSMKSEHGPKAMKSHYSAKGRYGAWGNSCPPGLARKNNGCSPPGQLKKRFDVGQRWTGTSGYRWDYAQVPMTWRQQYDLDQANRYYYRDGYLYSVDPRTRLVEDVIRAIL